MKLIVVDPQNDPRLVNWIMIKAVADQKDPFNLFSILDYGFRLDKLAPIDMILPYLKEDENGSDVNSLNFDKMYASQIIGNDEVFIDFMKLMNRVNEEEDTVLISNYNSPIIMPIIDSLLKFIQQRYGINAFILNALEDYESIHLKYCEFGSCEQQMVYMKDVERFARLTKQPILTVTQREIEEDRDCFYESMQTEMPLVVQQVPDIK